MSEQVRLEQAVKKVLEAKRPKIELWDNQGPTNRVAKIAIAKQNIIIPIQTSSTQTTQLGSFR